MKKTFTLLISLTCMALLRPVQLKSQNLIQGIVKRTVGKPLQFANVLLLKQSDSSLVKGTVTDASGKYFFENNPNGKYLVTASFAGLKQKFIRMVEVVFNKLNVTVDTI